MDLNQVVASQFIGKPIPKGITERSLALINLELQRKRLQKIYLNSSIYILAQGEIEKYMFPVV